MISPQSCMGETALSKTRGKAGAFTSCASAFFPMEYLLMGATFPSSLGVNEEDSSIQS